MHANEFMEINKIYQGDALSVLKTLAGDSVDCCITSPPYWKLRDYEIKGQLGDEPHFSLFIDNLCAIFSEIKRVLKPTGTCFVVLGDTYNGDKKGNGDIKNPNVNTKSFLKVKIDTIKNKCLLMIPARFTIKMIDMGWILRNQNIWHKPNQMPSSVTDRFIVDFENVFFFVKQQKYFFDHLAVQEGSIWAEYDHRFKDGATRGGKTISGKYAMNSGGAYQKSGMRNKRSVWSINTEPFGDAHFATYPQELVNVCIKAGCPEGGIVIDPFMGAGTTGLVARKLNRNYIGIELNQKYIDIAEKRIFNEIGLFL